MARGAMLKKYRSNILVKRNLRIGTASVLRSLGCCKNGPRVRQQENNHQGDGINCWPDTTHSRSEIKHPTASVVDTGGWRPLLAASIASANSCVVAARRGFSMCSERVSMR